MENDDAPARVVVTGGAGFIGANLCSDLVTEHGINVVVVDDLTSGRRENLDGLDVELVRASILDRPVLDEVMTGAQAVVHLAARGSVPRSLEDPVETHAVNATGTVQVLEAARAAGVPHLLYASSSSVYGASAELPKRETAAPKPVSPYAASKLAAEAYVLAYARSFDLEALAFRFFNVYGPLQPAGHAYAAVVPTFVDAALRGLPLPVYGEGRQTRDFTYVGSVVRVLTTALLERRTHPDPVNLAFGTRVSLLELVAELTPLLGVDVRLEHRPPRVGDIPHSQADDRVLRSLFPRVQATALSEGLAQTVEWFRSTGPYAARPDG